MSVHMDTAAHTFRSSTSYRERLLAGALGSLAGTGVEASINSLWNEVSATQVQYLPTSSTALRGAQILFTPVPHPDDSLGAERPGIPFRLVFVDSATEIPSDERRGLDDRAERQDREAQRRRNSAAIALLDTWLADDSDAAGQAEGLQKTVLALNDNRSSSRKLFP